MAIILTVVGCGNDNQPSFDAGSAPIDASSPDASVNTDATTCTPGRVAYLNRNGGTFVQGTPDSFADTTTVVDGSQLVGAFPYDDATWNAVTTCFREGLSDFNVSIVETDPGDVDHIELVFSDVYWTSPTSPFELPSVSAFSCVPSPRQIAFVFGSAFQATDTLLMCETALFQFGAAAASLEHVVGCVDYMADGAACGNKVWVDSSISCSTNQVAADCFCGGTTQNSFQTMLTALGPSCQ